MSVRRVLVVPILLALAITGCSRDPETARQQHLERGDAYVAKGDLREAELEYRNAIQQDQAFGEARFKLAQVYVQLGNGNGALAEAVRAADLMPEHTDVQMLATQILLAAGRTADARDRVQAVVAREPHNVEARTTLANALAGLRDFDGALAQLQEAIKVAPDDSQVHTSLGALYLTRGELKAAEAAFMEAVAREPEAIAAHLALGNFHWGTNRLFAAENAFKEAVRLAPAHVRANRTLAAFYQAVGRASEAEPYMTAATEADQSPAARIMLADFYLSIGRTDKAVPVLETVAGGTDLAQSGKARTRLARLELQQGKVGRARELVDRVLADDAQNEEALLMRADLYARAGQLDQASDEIELAIASHPGSATALAARGRLLLARNQDTEAIQAFTEAAKLDPRSSEARLELARLHLKRGDVETSGQLAGEAVAANPNNISAHLVRVRSLIASGQHLQAAAALKTLIAQVPGNAKLHAEMGMLLSATRDTAGAAMEFKRALELDPSELTAAAGLVRIDLERGRTAEALTRVDALLAQAPDNAGAMLLAAQARTAAKDLKGAEQVLIRTITGHPSLLLAYSMLGNLYLHDGRLEEAQRQFERLAERQPSPVAALTMVGIIQQLQQKTGEARQTFERVMEIDPEAAIAANNLAWIYSEQDVNPEAALALAQTAKARLGEQPAVNDTLGWAYYRKGLYPQAVRFLQQAAKDAPNNALYHYRLGMASAKAGDDAAARRALRTALNLDPTLKNAPDATALLARMGEPNDAGSPPRIQ